METIMSIIQRVFDVTDWTIDAANAWTSSNTSETCYTDIGIYINDIIAYIKLKQANNYDNPGAVIYIEPGDYRLKTTALIDVSYLTIRGSNHGFFSTSIKNNTSTTGWKELWPGGSHVLPDDNFTSGVLFKVERTGSNRLNSVTFQNFCIDGKSFGSNENSYTNGLTGINFASDNDSFRIDGMGFVYLEQAILGNAVDALSITNNMIGECGGCISLTGSGQATQITNNLMGAGYNKPTVYLDGHNGCLIQGNNIFPRGASSITLDGCSDCSITSNRLHSFYPGMIQLLNSCNDNLISGNHFLRETELWIPMIAYNNGLDDWFGLVHINGDHNFVSANIFHYNATPISATTPTIILNKSGQGNNFSSNNFNISASTWNAVVLDSSTTKTSVAFCGGASNFVSYAASSEYAFVAQPPMGTFETW
jgi:inulin fructotransferase (DFA-I-forming)